MQEYLDRIADVQSLSISLVLARVQRALPDWRRRLQLRIAAHDLALAAHRALGGQEDRIEQTRLAVVDVLDGAQAADASQQELDDYVRELRIAQCDLVSVLTAAGWLAAERARLAQQRAMKLPAPAWATTTEIAHDRSVPSDIVQRLVDEALRRGLLASLPQRGFVLTPAGRHHAEQATTS